MEKKPFCTSVDVHGEMNDEAKCRVIFEHLIVGQLGSFPYLLVSTLLKHQPWYRIERQEIQMHPIIVGCSTL